MRGQEKKEIVIDKSRDDCFNDASVRHLFFQFVYVLVLLLLPVLVTGASFEVRGGVCPTLHGCGVYRCACSAHIRPGQAEEVPVCRHNQHRHESVSVVSDTGYRTLRGSAAPQAKVEAPVLIHSYVLNRGRMERAEQLSRRLGYRGCFVPLRC